MVWKRNKRFLKLKPSLLGHYSLQCEPETSQQTRKIMKAELEPSRQGSYIDQIVIHWFILISWHCINYIGCFNFFPLYELPVYAQTP